jgi:hypothetical protein
MLSAKKPDVLKMGEYLAHFSSWKKPHIATMNLAEETQETIRERKKTSGVPGPGAYRVNRDYPMNDLDDMPTHMYTGVRVNPKYSIPHDARMNQDGTLKGIARKECHSLGPGQYEMHRMGTRSREKSFTTHAIPKSKETQEALRERKRGNTAPGPGQYNIARYGEDLGQEKTRIMAKVLRKEGTQCWAANQYSHVYNCMKPRAASTPNLTASLKKTPEPASPEATAA